MPVRFGEFVMDEGRRQLLRGAEPLHLPAKQFTLLGLLVERRPNAVPKRELYDRLWPDTCVAPENLSSLIADLRTALGDDAHHPQFIRTIHGFGYAFCGDPGSPPPPDDVCMATLLGKNVELRFAAGETILGRERGLGGVIDDPSVSRRHAAVACTQDSCAIRDLGSKNGTLVGGVRISAPRELRDGDVVELGSVRLVFHRAPARSTITAMR